MYVYIYDDKFIILLNSEDVYIRVGGDKINFSKKLGDYLVLKSFYLFQAV